MKEEMKHLLDVDTLREWGFQLALPARCVDDDEVFAGSYHMESITWTDFHRFNGLSLTMILSPNVNHIWTLCYTKEEGSFSTLFTGVINSKEDLEKVLELCIVFKPSEDNLKGRECAL